MEGILKTKCRNCFTWSPSSRRNCPRCGIRYIAGRPPLVVIKKPEIIIKNELLLG